MLVSRPLALMVPMADTESLFSGQKCVQPQSPDICPAGSVGENQDRSFILGQAGHYSKDYTFNAFQNVSSGKKRRESNTDYKS